MQIVYISNRPDILSDTLQFVRTFMSFVQDVLVFCPARDVAVFRQIDRSLRVFDEDELLGPQIAEFHDTCDHARKNYILRSQVPYFPDVAGEFIMSDDDSRPLYPIEATYFVNQGRHQAFFFYVLEKWDGIIGKRLTSYDSGNLNTFKALKDADLGTVLFSSHMPQVVDRELLRASVEFFRPALSKYGSLTEWETYFNFAIDRAPERFQPPRPFTVLGWPDKPHWPWFVWPERFDFENFHPESYSSGGMFEGLCSKYDGSTHAAVTAEKVRRYSECFARAWERRRSKRRMLQIARRLLAPTQSLRNVKQRIANVLPRRRRLSDVEWAAAPFEIVGVLEGGSGRCVGSMLTRTLEQCMPAGAISKIDLSALVRASSRNPPKIPAPQTDKSVLVVCLSPLIMRKYLHHVRCTRPSKRKIVGYWSSDLPTFPMGWQTVVDNVDEIWVSSRFTFENWRNQIRRRVRWVPLDLRDTDTLTPKTTKHLGQAVRVLSIFDLESTNLFANPEGSIEVVRRVRERIGPRIYLTLHIEGLAAYPNRYVDFVRQLGSINNWLTITAGDLTQAKVRRLIDCHDLVLSMHRSAGLGLPMAQAMARGKVVCATGWSGNMDFMDAVSTILIDYDLREIQSPESERGAMCADPSIEDAAAKMIELVSDVDRLKVMGERARTAVAAISEAHLAQVRAELFPTATSLA